MHMRNHKLPITRLKKLCIRASYAYSLLSGRVYKVGFKPFNNH